MTPETFYDPANGILTRMPEEKRHQLIGEIVSLMLASDVHRRYLINDIGAVFFPPIHLNQFRIYRRKGKPIGLLTWARLSEEVERKYVKGGYNLRLEDWNSGQQGWIIDFLAPYGDAMEIARDMRFNVFPNEVGKSIRVSTRGEVLGIRKLHGVNSNAAARAMDISDLEAELDSHYRELRAARREA